MFLVILFIIAAWHAVTPRPDLIKLGCESIANQVPLRQFLHLRRSQRITEATWPSRPWITGWTPALLRAAPLTQPPAAHYAKAKEPSPAH